MHNSIRIMALNEEQTSRVVFVNPREEGGINAIYDPSLSKFVYQVFIHNRFPYKCKEAAEFERFEEARSFASKRFAQDWEMLEWGGEIKRPCADGGAECGSGSCEMCKSTGGGCKSCGASDEKFAQ